MKKSFIFIFVNLLFLQSFSQNQDSVWLRDNYYKMERMIPMRDGNKLFTAIYVPKDTSEKHPILMTRTPYSCYPYGENNFSSRLYETYWMNYVRMNYIMVIQDVRGRFMSEGDFVDVRPFNPNKKGKEFDEASDTYDAIDWLINNVPGNNRRVGVFGISYPGFYATMASFSGHPALKAVSPQAPVTDWFAGDDFHHNGAFFYMDAFSFYSGFGKPRPVPTTSFPTGFEMPTPDNYDFYLRTGALKNFTKLIGDSIAFWKDLMAHPNNDEWWKARNTRNFVSNVKPAILIVGGLFDAEDCFGAFNLYKAYIQKAPLTETKFVEGPWFHGGWARSDGTFLGNVRFGKRTSAYYQRNIEIPFFEFYLRLKGTVSGIPGASVFFTGENNWRKFATWPPANAISRNAYLIGGGKISVEGVDAVMPVNEKDGSNGSESYISDPAHPVPYTEDVHEDRTREYMTDDQRFASRRTDVLTYKTDILNGDLTVGGTVVADLMTSISTTDADFVVKIIDVFPDNFKYDATEMGSGNGKDYPMGGYQMLVRGEIMRGRFRNSLEKPEAFIPGKITEVKFSLPDIAHTFKKGHRLMIQIQSSWFPLADRNPQKFVDIYHCDDSDFQKAEIKIYHEPGAISKIILPVIN